MENNNLLEIIKNAKGSMNLFGKIKTIEELKIVAKELETNSIITEIYLYGKFVNTIYFYFYL